MRGGAFADGYVPVAALQAPQASDPFAAHGSYVDIAGGVSTVRSMIKRVPDLRNAVLASVFVCHSPPAQPDVTDGSWKPCIGRGVVGARVEIEPPAGTRVYVAAGGFPDPIEPFVSTNSIVTFYDLPPGDYTVRVLKPAEASEIDCTTDVPFTNFGWPQIAPNTFPIRVVEGGCIVGAAAVFCTVTP